MNAFAPLEQYLIGASQDSLHPLIDGFIVRQCVDRCLKLQYQAIKTLQERVMQFTCYPIAFSRDVLQDECCVVVLFPANETGTRTIKEAHRTCK